MKTVKSAQAAIDAVAAGAVAVYEDTYWDQVNPAYHILETAEEQTEFERLVRQVKEAEGFEVLLALKALEAYIGQPCETSDLYPIFREGKWVRDPEELLDEEFDLQQMEEDAEWFDAAREGFREMEDPTPIVADEPWRRKVNELATKIAAAEGRAPEEADFNAAMLQLADEIPQEAVGRLMADLKAIEEGRSTACPWG